MQLEFKVTIINVDKVVRKVKNRQLIRDGIGAATQYVYIDAQEYPKPKPKRRGTARLTRAQYRAFFWKLKNGKTTYPYKRFLSPDSEQLSGKWRMKIEKSGLQGRVYNRGSYAEYVYSNQKQYHMHKRRWPNVNAIAKRTRKKVMSIVSFYVGKGLNT